MKKLAIFYGYPSTVSDYTIEGAVNTFKNYDLLVLGFGLHNFNHPDHLNTYNIINHPDMNNTLVFGYIDNLKTIKNNKSIIDKWLNLGVDGIFCNQWGYDFNTSRNYQNSIVDYIHSKNLIAFINAWNPDDVLSNNAHPILNPFCTPHNLNSTDWYLAESWTIKNGLYDTFDSNNDNVPDWIDKGFKLLNYNINVASITTVNDLNNIFDQQKADFSYYSAILFGFKAWGWGEVNYSALGGPNSLPFRNRKFIPPYSNYISSIINNSNTYKRKLNVGVKIDTNNFTVSNILNL